MKFLVVLRAVAVAHAIAVCLQPFLAGAYLNGSGAAMRLHEPIGHGAASLVLVQLLIATLYWRSGGRGSAVVVTVLLLAAEGIQIGIGYSRQLALHIPVGVAIVAIACVFAAWTFRPAAKVEVPS